MNVDAAATLRTRARRQLSNGRCSVHVTAEQVYELCAAYLDAMDRLERLERSTRWSRRGKAEQLSKPVP